MYQSMQYQPQQIPHQQMHQVTRSLDQQEFTQPLAQQFQTQSQLWRSDDSAVLIEESNLNNTISDRMTLHDHLRQFENAQYIAETYQKEKESSNLR